MKPPFKTGDHVKLKTGKSKIIIVEVKHWDGNGRLKNYSKRKFGTPNLKYEPKEGWYVRFSYNSSMQFERERGHDRKWREAKDFVFYDPQPSKKEKEAMTKPLLYQTKTEPARYGTFLITNSKGEMVLEMKGENGKCEPFAEGDIEVVTAFTVQLTRIGFTHEEKRGATNSCNIVANKDQLSKDDVLLELNTGIIWRVTQTDSKCLSPRENKSKWMKIPVEFIAVGE